MSVLRYTVGLDLGMGAEPTTLAILERPRVEPEDKPDKRQPSYALRHLHRFPLGSAFPTIAHEVKTLLSSPTLSGAWLLIDYTGVGRAVIRLVLSVLSGQPHTWTAVLLSASHGESIVADGEMLVAKTELVGTLQVLLQSRRLQIANDLPHARLLVRELENYRPKVTLSATDVLQWRDGTHDDLVLAVALAAWGGERSLRRELRERRQPSCR